MYTRHLSKTHLKYSALPALSLFAMALAPSAQAACPTGMPDTLFKNCITAEMEGLYAAVINSVEANNALQVTVDALEAENAALRAYLTVDEASDSIIFSGANVYVQSGSGGTAGTVNGLGNLVLGYDEDDGADDKSGSHNLVLGVEHSYSSYGGLLSGQNNAVTDAHSSSISGSNNTVTSSFAAAVAGGANTVSGQRAASLGGAASTISGSYAAIVGGSSSTASGTYSVVVAGGSHEVSGLYAAAVGGGSNIVTGSAPRPSPGALTTSPVTTPRPWAAAPTTSAAIGPSPSPATATPPAAITARCSPAAVRSRSTPTAQARSTTSWRTT